MVQIKLDRFKGIEKHEFTLEILTPMFLGGANPQDAELRAASIKGALRFWWRALQAETNINDLRRRENEIFGGSEGDSGQKSRVKIEVDENKIECGEQIPNSATVCIHGNNIPILKYLTVGLYRFGGGVHEFNRNYIKEGTFNIKLFFPETYPEVLDAFYLMVYCGGLGAKSRNGFGSLNISKGSVRPLLEIFRNKDFNLRFENLNYAAFSQDSRLFESVDDFDNPLKALEHAGLTYFALKASLKPDHLCERRRYLGLPLIPCNQRGRQAKWIFIRVFKTPESKYKSRFLFLPHRLRIRNFDLNIFNDVFNHCQNRIVQEGIPFGGFDNCNAGVLGGNYEEIEII